MSKNSFKELEKEQAERFQMNTKKVKDRVDGSFKTIGLFTNIVELYFSRLIDIFLNMSVGASKINTESGIIQNEVEEEE